MTVLVAVTEHLTEGARKRSVDLGLWFQGTQSTMAGKASRVALCLQESSAAASHMAATAEGSELDGNRKWT